MMPLRSFQVALTVVFARGVQDFGLSTAYTESVVSTLMVGAVVGSLGGGLVADWCVAFSASDAQLA